jgi:predicted nucleic acid-binding protein
VRVVADACFAGAWLLPDEQSRNAERLLREILRGDRELCVPSLWTYEVTNLLVSAERRKRIGSEQVTEALRLVAALPRQVFDHESPLSRQRTAVLARRCALSVYDAAYLELADRLQCGLETLDSKLRRAAKQMSRPGRT